MMLFKFWFLVEPDEIDWVNLSKWDEFGGAVVVVAK